jgi:hypothetical protein
MAVTIFEDVNFQGRSITLDVGSHRLLAASDLNDEISSIRVPPGLVALVFEHADDAGGFGRSADLLEDVSDLGRIGLGDTISFVEVFASERTVQVRNHATGATETSRVVWARGSLVNGQYIAGHWERPRASGPTTPGPIVVSPGPLPHLLRMSKLTGDPWTNPPFDTSAANWSSALVGGATFDGSDAHGLEWVSVLDPTIEQDDQVGVTGFALNAELSGADLPFTHPFGPDFEYAVYPDAEYRNLLAPSNEDPNGTYGEAFPDARRVGLPPAGVLGMEVDAALVPGAFRAATGDRVALYGRWIVDAGHEDFHAEIHPPLVMARARIVNAQDEPGYPTSDATTLVNFWSRPYQSGQRFGSKRDQSLESYLTDIATTLSDIKAYPPVFETSFQGIHLLAFTVKAPVPTVPVSSAEAIGMHLECSYSFTVNQACGLQVQQAVNDPEAVMVIMALNSAGFPSSLPELPSGFDSYLIDDLVAQIPSDLGTLSSLLVGIVKAYQSKLGLTDAKVFVRRFGGPPAPDLSGHVVPFTRLASLPKSSVNLDNNQPFPVMGWLKLRWVSDLGGIIGTIDPGLLTRPSTVGVHPAMPRRILRMPRLTAATSSPSNP